MSQTISKQALDRLVDQWVAQDRRVAGPRQVRPGLMHYTPITSADQLVWDPATKPTNSIKQFVFPRNEKLYDYRIGEKQQIELVDAEPFDGQQIIVGARPCDTAALAILDAVFNWDCADAFYNRRRERTTVVTLACQGHDVNCFCTSVGSGPGDERGSDVLLVDLGNGSFEVRCLTDKGRTLFDGQTQASDSVGTIGPGPERSVDLEAVGRFLANGYDSPLWQSSLRCLGCGACAYTCPTCHCFDIVDERTAGGGQRVRNWDSCQFTMFTVHASGHNPRSVQAQRQRQRVYHKFRTYPEKFGQTLCTGCGNCARNCPVHLGVQPMLKAIQQATANSPLPIPNS
jgi:ferredoxin